MMSRKSVEFALKTLDPNAPKHTGDYHIKSFQLIYKTTSPKGKPVEASALVVIRSDIFSERKKPRSWFHYSHGARFESETSPSTLAYDPEALGARVFLAREGHLVLLPDYLGLGVNGTELQSYLNAKQQAQTSWDALLALKEWSEEIELPQAERLILGGYSQGGFVTLALQRKMQLENLDIGSRLVASFPMAGPYNFSGFSEDKLLEDAHPQLYGFIAFMIISLSQDPRYSDIDLYETVAEPFHPILEKVLKKEMSLLEFTAEAAKVRYDFYTEDFLDTVNDESHPIFKAVSDQNLTKDWVPKVPTIFMAARDDEIIPYKITEKTYIRFNDNGAEHIEFIELPKGLGHVDAIHPAMILLRDQAERFLK